MTKGVLTVKKKAIIIALILVLCVGIIGAYTALDSIFPKADPVICPELNEIESVLIAQNKGEYVAVSAEEIAELLQRISLSEPTRKMSVNDYPTAKTYYKLEISADRMYCYFIYQESGQVYVELPYEGVYKSDNIIIDYIEEIYLSI